MYICIAVQFLIIYFSILLHQKALLKTCPYMIYLFIYFVCNILVCIIVVIKENIPHQQAESLESLFQIL